MKFKAQFSEKSRRTVCTRPQPDTWATLPGCCCTGNYLWSRQAVPCSRAGILAPNWEKGQNGQFLFCCFLFMDITSSALQVLKMFLVFLGWIKQTLLLFSFFFFLAVSPPVLICRRRAEDKIKQNAEVLLSNFFAKMEVMKSVILLGFLSLPHSNFLVFVTFAPHMRKCS